MAKAAVAILPDKEEDLKRVIPGGFDESFEQPATPAKLINYVSAHDNSTLWDKLVDSVLKDGSYTKRNEKLIAMNKLCATIVQLSKGVPFWQAGEEAARTKLGEDNSFNIFSNASINGYIFFKKNIHC